MIVVGSSNHQLATDRKTKKLFRILFSTSESMHTDLSPHLHTPDCNKLIEQLHTCHTENKFSKFLGVCNDIDSQLLKCLKKERQARSAANRAKAAEKQARIRESMSSEKL